jgi:hypothetical protein
MQTAGKTDPEQVLVAQALCLCGFVSIASGAQPRLAVLFDFFCSLFRLSAFQILMDGKYPGSDWEKPKATG